MSRFLPQASLFAGCALILAACGDPGRKAARQLTAAGYTLHVDGLLEAARAGDLAAVQRFMVLGYQPGDVNAEMDAPLVLAAAGGHRGLVEWLVAHDAPISRPGSEGRSALHLAAERGHFEIVQILVINGADLTLKDDKDWVPVSTAAYHGHADVVALLRDSEPKDLGRALIVAAIMGHEDVADTLCRMGTPVDPRSGNGQTPLMNAAQRGHLEMVKLLLRHGADRGLRNDEGETAVDLATRAGKHKVVQALIGLRPVTPADRPVLREVGRAGAGEVPGAPPVAEPVPAAPEVSGSPVSPYAVGGLDGPGGGDTTPPPDLHPVTGRGGPRTGIPVLRKVEWPSIQGCEWVIEPGYTDARLSRGLVALYNGRVVALGLGAEVRFYEVQVGDIFHILRRGSEGQRYRINEVGPRRVVVENIATRQAILVPCQRIQGA